MIKLVSFYVIFVTLLPKEHLLSVPANVKVLHPPPKLGLQLTRLQVQPYLRVADDQVELIVLVDARIGVGGEESVELLGGETEHEALVNRVLLLGRTQGILAEASNDEAALELDQQHPVRHVVDVFVGTGRVPLVEGVDLLSGGHLPAGGLVDLGEQVLFE